MKLPKAPNGARKIRYWDPHADIPAIFQACHQEQRGAFGCMYFGAMRGGDVRGLRWEHVDFESNTITLNSENTKSGRTETIAMLPDLHTLLAARHRHAANCSTGLVFPNRKGTPFERNYSWMLKELLASAKVEAKERSCHAFRHSAAISAASGVWCEKWSQDEVAKLVPPQNLVVGTIVDVSMLGVKLA